MLGCLGSYFEEESQTEALALVFEAWVLPSRDVDAVVAGEVVVVEFVGAVAVGSGVVVFGAAASCAAAVAVVQPPSSS